jgi:hypothetical protein
LILDSWTPLKECIYVVLSFHVCVLWRYFYECKYVSCYKICVLESGLIKNQAKPTGLMRLQSTCYKKLTFKLYLIIINFNSNLSSLMWLVVIGSVNRVLKIFKQVK